MTNAPANHYTPAKRTKVQVQKFLAKCAKNGSDKSAAKLMLNHGQLEADAMEFVVAYLR
jgi:hypothetical protein